MGLFPTLNQERSGNISNLIKTNYIFFLIYFFILVRKYFIICYFLFFSYYFLFFNLTSLYFFNFILFLNFTILYWFCKVSKWIRHRYTCVPHPEPSTLLLLIPSKPKPPYYSVWCLFVYYIVLWTYTNMLRNYLRWKYQLKF